MASPYIKSRNLNIYIFRIQCCMSLICKCIVFLAAYIFACSLFSMKVLLKLSEAVDTSFTKATIIDFI